MGDFYRKLPLLRYHYTTFSPTADSKALIPLPGHRNSTRPSKSARQACHVPRYWHIPSHPHNLHLSQTPQLPLWVACCSNVSTTPGSHWHSPRSSTRHSKNSAYDQELLAAYEAVKHFRNMLEARYFIIFADHKPITYAFQRDKCSPRQFSHLDFIAQFTTDMRHISIWTGQRR
jgi:hypothetical protein